MAKIYIPKSGDKFTVFVKVSAFQGKVFTCTGRCINNHKICIQAKDSVDEKPKFAFDRHRYTFKACE